jgi:hypothetical protein
MVSSQGNTLPKAKSQYDLHEFKHKKANLKLPQVESQFKYTLRTYRQSAFRLRQKAQYHWPT